MDLPSGANELIEAGLIIIVSLAVVGGAVVFGVSWLWEKVRGKK